MFERFPAALLARHPNGAPGRPDSPRPRLLLRCAAATRLVLALIAALALTGLAPGAPPPVGGAIPVQAQTANPPPAVEPVIQPPPGTPVVQPELPTVPPGAVPPLVGQGTLAVVPAAAGAVSPITAVLGDNTRVTVLMPTDPAGRRAVLVQALADPVAAAAATPAGGGAGGAVLFGLYVYDVPSGAAVRELAQPAAVGVSAPVAGDVTLLTATLFDDATATFTTLPVTADPATGVLQFELSRTGLIFVGLVAQQ